jgi:hypothetical protein
VIVTVGIRVGVKVAVGVDVKSAIIIAVGIAVFDGKGVPDGCKKVGVSGDGVEAGVQALNNIKIAQKVAWNMAGFEFISVPFASRE